jgi:alcohol dehydrogenase (cytochrome c)
VNWRVLMLVLTLAGALPGQVTFERLLHADREPQNWLTYSGGYSSQRYSLLTQVAPNNVKDLKLKWVYSPKNPEQNGSHAVGGRWDPLYRHGE